MTTEAVQQFIEQADRGATGEPHLDLYDAIQEDASQRLCRERVRFGNVLDVDAPFDE